MDYVSEPKCIKLLAIMCDTVYPKLFELMEHNDMKSVTIELNGANNLVISIDGKMIWEKPGINDVVNEYKLTNDSDPVFRSYSNLQKIYSGQNDMYVAHCQVVMDKIEELEKLSSKIDMAIERAGKIGLVFNRVVLTEKTKYV
jgi:hypothetical protein